MDIPEGSEANYSDLLPGFCMTELYSYEELALVTGAEMKVDDTCYRHKTANTEYAKYT